MAAKGGGTWSALVVIFAASPHTRLRKGYDQTPLGKQAAQQEDERHGTSAKQSSSGRFHAVGAADRGGHHGGGRSYRHSQHNQRCCPVPPARGGLRTVGPDSEGPDAGGGAEQTTSRSPDDLRRLCLRLGGPEQRLQPGRERADQQPGAAAG